MTALLSGDLKINSWLPKRFFVSKTATPFASVTEDQNRVSVPATERYTVAPFNGSPDCLPVTLAVTSSPLNSGTNFQVGPCCCRILFQLNLLHPFVSIRLSMASTLPGSFSLKYQEGDSTYPFISEVSRR